MMRDRGQLLLGIAALVAALVAVWMLALAPKREHVADLAGRIVLAEGDRDAALARATAGTRALATYGHDYATVARLGKAVPVSADVPSLVFQLESAARRAKVDFRGVSVLDTTPQPTTPVTAAPASGAASASGTATTPGATTASGGATSASGGATSASGGATSASGGATTSGATTTASAAAIEPVPFSFKFEGSYFGLQKLLAAVDRFSRVKGTQVAVDGRLLTIDGVAITPGRGGLPRVRGVVTARAYVADLPAALPRSGVQPAALQRSAPGAVPAAGVAP
jgi:hypothetical protein